jgi:hypothetical protein
VHDLPNQRRDALRRCAVSAVNIFQEFPDNVRAWLAAFAKGMATFEAFLPTVPSSWLPQHRKQFAIRLLNQRLRWLEGLM